MSHLPKKFIVITTINGYTEAIKCWSLIPGWHLIVVGDTKTPEIKNTENLTYLSIEKQEKLNLSTYPVTPFNSYARKNIGYLYAIKNGADIIYDTDDDTFPTQKWGIPATQPSLIASHYSRYINYFSEFSDLKCWPRGFPYQHLQSSFTEAIKYHKNGNNLYAPILCGVINGDPDVDAIYRLTQGCKINYRENETFLVAKDCWAPFNSQNTFWFKEAFHLLYLPNTAKFRMTDIIRSYIAQAILKKNGRTIGIFGPTVFQDRNVHNLMDDLMSELDGLIGIPRFLELIGDKAPESYSTEYLYKLAISNNLLNERELIGYSAWLLDLRNSYNS